MFSEERGGLLPADRVGGDRVARLLLDGLHVMSDDDVVINRRTARGLRSRFARPGRASRLEEGCWQFHRWQLAQTTS
ncbi:MAG: hypothetical protein KatS3mg010_1114 [Acidimicrobiia bacterium]|nr:MAG: hypothetical protein KatS3mg010_1114 [Acidimicrobiia bacterium]